MLSESPEPVGDPTESLLVACLEADSPTVALEDLCLQHPDNARVLRRRFALAQGMGLVAGTAAPRDARRQQVGDFRLIRELGHGGMGVVWLAEQVSLGRKVALKLLRPGFGTAGLAKRLRHEAEVLGQLHHRAIAHVYEAGATVLEEGLEQPFFAMEFIDGRALDLHAKENDLGTTARLELMAQVADAVAHAHEHGVVHRDLKPDNILVDRDGQPKILDFGIARLTDSDIATVTMTATGQVMGTLPYMSPEQVIGDSREIDARTDIYALGVILFQLLTGRPPIDVRGLSLVEAARRISEDAPMRLGTVQPAYRGDIETIVGKALAKQKHERYQSMHELAADIRRSLDNEPIVAQQPTVAYNLRKFARRHRALVGGILATATALLIGTVVAVTFAVLATQRLEESHRSLYRLNVASALNELAKSNVEAAARYLDAAPEELRGWEWHYAQGRLGDMFVLRHPEGRNIELRKLPGEATFAVSVSPHPMRFDPETREWSELDGELPPPQANDKRVLRPDGRVVATGTNDGKLQLLDANTLAPLRVLRGLSNRVNAIVFSGDGRWVAHRSFAEKTTWLLQRADIEDPRAFTEHSSFVYGVAVSAAGRIASAAWTDGNGAESELRVWRPGRPETETRCWVTAIDDPTKPRASAYPTAVAFSPDGERVAMLDQQSRLFVRSVSGDRVWQRDGYPGNLFGPIVFAPDSRAVLWPGEPPVYWHPENGKETVADDDVALTQPSRGVMRRVLLRVAGNPIAILEPETLPRSRHSMVVSVRDARTGEKLGVLEGHDDEVLAIAASPDGRRIATGGRDKVIRIWHAETFEELAVLEGHTDYVFDLAWSPDGATLVSGSGDGTVRIWKSAAR